MTPIPTSTPIQCDCVQWWKTREGRLWFGFFTLGLLLTRMAFLGIHSPWNDEVANWSWASQLPGGAIEGKHWLTYWTIWLFTRVHDSIFFVRLPMMLLTTLACLGFASVIWNRFSPAVGKTLLLLMLFNPMLTFYSIDANHYAYVFSSGAVCAVGALYVGLVRNWKERLLLVFTCGTLVALASLAHPFAAFPFAGFAAVLLLDLWLRPTEWFGPRERVSLMARSVALGIATAMILLGIAVLNVLQKNISTVPLKGGVYFNFSPQFLGDVVANFFGSYLEFSWWDTGIGILAMLACIAGFFYYSKTNRYALYVGISTGVQFCVAATFFSVLEVSNYFHLRYMIFMLPGLLLGVSLFVNQKESVTQSITKGHSPVRKVLMEAYSLLVPLLILRWVIWAVPFYTGNFQPLVPALRYIAETLPPNSIVATRSDYLAQAYRFLASHDPRFSHLQIEWLGKAYPVNQVAASRAEYLAATQYRSVFLLEMKEYDNQLSEAYHAFAKNQPLLKTFASSATKDFFPFDRSLELRSVPKNIGFGRLPIVGSAASQVFPINPTAKFYPAAVGEPFTQLVLSPGSGASYFIQQQPEGVDSFWVDALLNGATSEPLLIMGVMEPEESVTLSNDDQASSGTLLLWSLKKEQSLFSLEVPVIPNHDARLTLFFCNPPKESSSKDPIPLFRIEGLRNVEPGFKGLEAAQYSLADCNQESTLRLIDRRVLNEPAEQKFPVNNRWSVSPEPDAEGPFLWEKVKVTEPTGKFVFALFHLETTGLSSQGVDLQIQTGGLQQSVLSGTNTSSTLGPLWAGALVSVEEQDNEIETVYQLVHQKVIGPQFGHLTAEGVRFFVIPETQ